MRAPFCRDSWTSCSRRQEITGAVLVLLTSASSAKHRCSARARTEFSNSRVTRRRRGAACITRRNVPTPHRCTPCITSWQCWASRLRSSRRAAPAPDNSPRPPLEKKGDDYIFEDIAKNLGQGDQDRLYQYQLELAEQPRRGQDRPRGAATPKKPKQGAVVEAVVEAVPNAVATPRNSKLRWRGLVCGAAVALFLTPGFLEYLISVRTKALALEKSLEALVVAVAAPATGRSAAWRRGSAAHRPTAPSPPPRPVLTAPPRRLRQSVVSARRHGGRCRGWLGLRICVRAMPAAASSAYSSMRDQVRSSVATTRGSLASRNSDRPWPAGGGSSSIGRDR